MKTLSRCLILGCNFKYAWPMWSMFGVCLGFIAKTELHCAVYIFVAIALIILWALVALPSLRLKIIHALFVIALSALIIVLNYNVYQSERQSEIMRPLEYSFVSGRGKIVKIYASTWNIRALLCLQSGSLVLVESTDKRLQSCEGQSITFTGLLVPVAEDKGFLQRLRITHVVKIKKMQISPKSKAQRILDGSQLRLYLKEKIDATFEPGCREIVAAMFLGCSDYLPKEEKALFRDVGLSHMTAASGFHLSIVAAVAMLCAVWSGYSRRLGAYGAIALCSVYVFTVGWLASILRAFCMGVLALLALPLGRPLRLERTVCLAWSLMLWIYPQWIEDVGFQLSFGAIFGIICWASVGNRLLSFLPNFFKQSISLTLSVNIFLLPLLINYFQKLPSASVLANLLIVPALEAVFILIIPSLLLACLPILGRLFPYICALLCRYSLAIATWLQNNLPIYECLPLSLVQICAFYSVLIVGRILWEFLPIRGRKNQF